jgi:hypothetical protein
VLIYCEREVLLVVADKPGEQGCSVVLGCYLYTPSIVFVMYVNINIYLGV